MRLVNTFVLKYHPLTVKCNICFHIWEPKPDPGEVKLKNLWYMCPRGCGDEILEEEIARKSKKAFPTYRRYW